MKGITTIVLLILSNVFMTFAWYGHLNLSKTKFLENKSLLFIIVLSWGIALLEYSFMVPANKIGYTKNGGPFNLFELKMIQEVISLTVFSVIAILVFKTETLQWNYVVGFLLMILAVFFVFKKW
jgi:uncharacterized protein (DUF486 family)